MDLKIELGLFKRKRNLSTILNLRFLIAFFLFEYGQFPIYFLLLFDSAHLYWKIKMEKYIRKHKSFNLKIYDIGIWLSKFLVKGFSSHFGSKVESTRMYM